MANRVDPAIAKQRKQKMILIVGGVLLVGLLAIQGPKLMKQLKGSKSAASSSSTATTPTTPTTTPGTPTTGTTSPAVANATGPSAQVAGVVIRTAGAPTAGTGQLFSFSRFKAKDPFVPQVKLPTGASASGGSGTTTTGSGATTASGGSGSVATPSTASPGVFAYATLMVNGKPQQLQLKQLFPKGLPTFVLAGVGKGFVKIGVAGGVFTGGGVVKLELGKPVTVMNTTTGQRFVMKLVYTGVQPEQIAGFKQPKQPVTQPATTTQGTTTTTTTTTSSTPY